MGGGDGGEAGGAAVTPGQAPGVGCAGPFPPPPGSLSGTSCLELFLGYSLSPLSYSDCLTLQEPSWLFPNRCMDNCS